MPNHQQKESQKRLWTAREEAILIEQRNTFGRLWTTIGELLSRDSEECRAYYHDLMHKRLLGRQKPEPTRVKCLGPLAPRPHYFISEDKTRVRVCPACKVWIAEQSPVIISIEDDIRTVVDAEDARINKIVDKDDEDEIQNTTQMKNEMGDSDDDEEDMELPDDHMLPIDILISKHEE